jgi:hypothetical protein
MAVVAGIGIAISSISIIDGVVGRRVGDLVADIMAVAIVVEIRVAIAAIVIVAAVCCLNPGARLACHTCSCGRLSSIRKVALHLDLTKFAHI